MFSAFFGGALPCASCHRSTEKASPPSPSTIGASSSPDKPDASWARCVVLLHGKSGKGAPPVTERGIRHVRPNGNARGWGGLQWLYFPDDSYQSVRAIVESAIEQNGCQKVIVHGFSNGAAAAAKLYYRGESFEKRVTGYIVDDPVPDHAVERCNPAAGVKLRLYWTGALANAVSGWSCSAADWTCEGGSTIGIQKYARFLAVNVTPRSHTKHQEYADSPEIGQWF
jgi:hypothetical protein